MRLEPQDAAKSTVHLVHEGYGRAADRFLKVCLIEGDEGRVRRDDSCDGGVQPAGVEAVDWMTRMGRRLAGLRGFGAGVPGLSVPYREVREPFRGVRPIGPAGG